jgi:hypothetical protein
VLAEFVVFGLGLAVLWLEFVRRPGKRFHLGHRLVVCCLMLVVCRWELLVIGGELVVDGLEWSGLGQRFGSLVFLEKLIEAFLGNGF